MINIGYKLLSEAGTLPTRGSAECAAFDLYYSGEDVIIAPGKIATLKIDIALEIPHGYYCKTTSRSGLASKCGVIVISGVIDTDYKGELKVMLMNTSNEYYMVKHKDKIAQMTIEANLCAQTEFYACDSLTTTLRGSNGFGSTGN